MKKSFERFYPLIIFVFACLLYANTIPNEYNLDDELVTINHRTTSKGLEGIKEIIHSFYYEDEMGYKYGYRPVTHISFAIEHHFFGENPHVGHAINVILYALLCLLIYYLTNKLAPDKGPILGLIVALIFVVHPIHTEVVASIKNRDEILSLLFGALAFLSAHWNFKQKNAFFAIQWLLAFLFFIIGVYSKNSILFFGILIPLSYILFGKFRKIVFPFLFFLGSALVLYFQARTSLTIIGFYVLFGLLLMGSTAFIKNELWSKTKDWIKTELWMKVKLWAVEKKTSIKLVLSTAIFVCFIVELLGIRNVELLLLVYIIYLTINEKLLKRSKVFLFLVLLITLSAVYFVEGASNDVPSAFAFFVILTVCFYYFRVGILLLPIVMLSQLFREGPLWVWYDIVRITLVIALFFMIILNNYWKNFYFYKLVKYASIFLLLIMFFPFNLDQHTFDYISTPIIETNVITEDNVNNVSLGEDRPLLALENPLVEQAGYAKRYGGIIRTYFFYLKKLILPYPLAFYYGYNEIEFYDLFSWQTIGAAVFLFSLIVLIICLFLKKKYLLSFALFFIILNIFPYSNFFTPVAGIVGERLAFSSSLGFALTLGALLYKWKLKTSNKGPIVVISFLLFLSSFYVVKRNFEWKDKFTLYSHDIRYLENSANAHALLAYEHMNIATVTATPIKENVELAIINFEKANSIYPKFLNWQYDLGKIYIMEKRFEEAKVRFENALAIDSSFTEPYYYLLEIANKESDFQSIERYTKLLLINDPNNLVLILKLSSALYFQEKYQEVLDLNDKLLSFNNQVPEGYLNKAYVFAKLGQRQNCLEAIEKGKNIAPNHKEIPNILKILNEGD